MLSAFSDVESSEEDIGTPPSNNVSSPKLDSTPAMPTFSGMENRESERSEQVQMSMDQFAPSGAQNDYIYRSDTEDDLSFVFRFHFGIPRSQNRSHQQARRSVLDDSSSEESDTEASHTILRSTPDDTCRERVHRPLGNSFLGCAGQSDVDLLDSPRTALPEKYLQEHRDSELQIPRSYQSSKFESNIYVDELRYVPPLDFEKGVEKRNAPRSCQDALSRSNAAPVDPCLPSPVSACQVTASCSTAAHDSPCLGPKGLECAKPQVRSLTSGSSIAESGSYQTSDIEKQQETGTHPKVRGNHHRPSIWKRICGLAVSAMSSLRSAPRRMVGIVDKIWKRICKLFSRFGLQGQKGYKGRGVDTCSLPSAQEAKSSRNSEQ